MTPEERARLERAHDLAEKHERDWWGPAPDGDRPMSERTAKAVRFAEAFETFVKWIIRGVLAMAAMVTAAAVLWDRFKGLF